MYVIVQVTHAWLFARWGWVVVEQYVYVLCVVVCVWGCVSSCLCFRCVCVCVAVVYVNMCLCGDCVFC